MTGDITPYHPVARHFLSRMGAGVNSLLRAALRPQAWIGGAVLALMATSHAFAAEGAPSGPSGDLLRADRTSPDRRTTAWRGHATVRPAGGHGTTPFGAIPLIHQNLESLAAGDTPALVLLKVALESGSRCDALRRGAERFGQRKSRKTRWATGLR
jgi:hypothetical protein